MKYLFYRSISIFLLILTSQTFAADPIIQSSDAFSIKGNEAYTVCKSDSRKVLARLDLDANGIANADRRPNCCGSCYFDDGGEGCLFTDSDGNQSCSSC